MSTANYWHRFASTRISRRRGLQATALGAASAAFLAACGGDDGGVSTGGTGGSGTNGLDTAVTNTTAEAKRGGILNWFTATESPSFDLATANLSNNDKILLTYNVLLQVKPGVLKASDREVAGEPLLCALDLAVAMIAPALEDHIGREPVLVPLQRERPRHCLCSGRARMARDQIQHEIVPRRRRARAHQFVARA